MKVAGAEAPLPQGLWPAVHIETVGVISVVHAKAVETGFVAGARREGKRS